MPALRDLTGQIFGRLTVIKRSEGNYKRVHWLCLCICGSYTNVISGSLTRGRTVSCGCYLKEKYKIQNITHGLTIRKGEGARLPREYTMLSAAKNRAKKENLAFDLELSDIVIPEFCPVFKHIKINKERKMGFAYDSPSLDKLVPLLGYVKGNVRIISNRANMLKRDATLAELKRLAEWMEEELKCTATALS